MEAKQTSPIILKRTFQYLAAVASSLNVVSTGMHYGWTSASLSELLEEDSHIPTTNDEGSWIAVVFLFGGVSGALLSWIILDRIGRKQVVLLTSFPFFISWIILAYAPSVTVLIIARFIAGISDGLIFCAVPVYLAEIADSEIRGLLESSIVVSFSLGNLLMSIVGAYFSIKMAALVSSTLPLLLLLTFSWMPESPYYFIMKGNLEQARRSLKIFRGSDVQDELSRIKKGVEEELANAGNFLDLFSKSSNRKAFCINLGVGAAHLLCGSLAFTFYAQIIFEESAEALSPTFASIIYFAVQMVSCIISSVTVDKYGRRPLMIISTTGSGLSLLVGGVYFYLIDATNVNINCISGLPIASLIIFVIAFNLGLQSIPILLMGELFPTNVKSFAFTFNDLYYCFLSVTVSKFFQYSKDEFGMHVPFLTFAAFSGVSLLFVIFFLPETRGKTLEEIQKQLKSKSDHASILELETMYQSE